MKRSMNANTNVILCQWYGRTYNSEFCQTRNCLRHKLCALDGRDIERFWQHGHCSMPLPIMYSIWCNNFRKKAKILNFIARPTVIISALRFCHTNIFNSNANIDVNTRDIFKRCCVCNYTFHDESNYCINKTRIMSKTTYRLTAQCTHTYIYSYSDRQLIIILQNGVSR